jgi:hypothetical protein
LVEMVWTHWRTYGGASRSWSVAAAICVEWSIMCIRQRIIFSCIFTSAQIIGYVLLYSFCVIYSLASDFSLFFICLLQSHKDGCNFWKSENVYEEHLLSTREILQDQTEASQQE